MWLGIVGVVLFIGTAAIGAVRRKGAPHTEIRLMSDMSQITLNWGSRRIMGLFDIVLGLRGGQEVADCHRVWVTPLPARRRTSPRRVPRGQPATAGVVAVFSLPYREVPLSTSRTWTGSSGRATIYVVVLMDLAALVFPTLIRHRLIRLRWAQCDQG
jgi:hypothetical protein